MYLAVGPNTHVGWDPPESSNYKTWVKTIIVKQLDLLSQKASPDIVKSTVEDYPKIVNNIVTPFLYQVDDSYKIYRLDNNSTSWTPDVETVPYEIIDDILYLYDDSVTTFEGAVDITSMNMEIADNILNI